MKKKVTLVAVAYAVVIITISILLGSCGTSHATCDAYSQVTTTTSNDVASK